jgi:hypothetical protein
MRSASRKHIDKEGIGAPLRIGGSYAKLATHSPQARETWPERQSRAPKRNTASQVTRRVVLCGNHQALAQLRSQLRISISA